MGVVGGDAPPAGDVVRVRRLPGHDGDLRPRADRPADRHVRRRVSERHRPRHHPRRRLPLRTGAVPRRRDRVGLPTGRRAGHRRHRVRDAAWWPGVSTSAAEGGRFGIRELLVASRPVSWINTGLPFLAAAYATTRSLDAVVVLGTLYFLFPYNLLLYGVNDLFDYASDVRNPRKQGVEGGLVAPANARVLVAAILVTNLPPLLLLVALGGAVAGVALAITVIVAVAYSAPPVRTKERPFLDSVTSALHFVLPAVCGFLVAGALPADVPWLVLAGFAAWGIASHAIGAIQDIEYDRAAGIGSIATVLGARRTAVVSLVGYAVAVVVAVTI